MIQLRERLLLAAMIVLVTQAPLAATLSGTVTEQGEPLSQVEVTLIKAGNNLIVDSVQTDVAGGYSFGTAAGRYRIRASRAEYSDAWVEGIALGESDQVVDIGMTPQVFVDDKVVSPEDECN